LTGFIFPVTALSYGDFTSDMPDPTVSFRHLTSKREKTRVFWLFPPRSGVIGRKEAPGNPIRPEKGFM
jgi:hypothetical protein